MADVKINAVLDSTQFTAGLQELRARVGMTLASATGFNNAAMGMAGFPGLGGGGFGQTHTNSAMAYAPHYGALQAHTTMQQEWQVQRYGLAAAHQLKPPGVSSSDYAMGAMSNAIDRDVQGRSEAQSAARSTFWTGMGGLGAGEVGFIAGGAAGKAIGGRLATRLLGAGAAGAGAAVGGLALGYMAFGKAQDAVGGMISDHYSRVEQIGGVTSELGDIAGGGRGLSRLQQYNLGVAARKASKDIGMPVQEMGDILALGRQSGMLPSSSDPGKARQQYREFAQAIEEGAQILQTSLAGATQVIKTATQQGMTAREGVAGAAGAGGADVWLAQQARMSAFGAAGAQAGRAMGFTGAQGRAMYTGSLGGGGLSGEEMKIMGGRFGAAGFVGSTQMAMAASPMGDMQLMAAQGGYGGGSMMDLAGGAMAAMSQGGDLIGNMIRFQVHKNEYRRGIGAGGIRTMAREQLRMGGEMLQDLVPSLSSPDAQMMFAQNMGLNPDQAKALVGGGRGRGGGGGAARTASQARYLTAMAGSMLGVQGGGLSEEEIAAKSEGSGFGFGRAANWGLMGLMGGWKGAALGATAGFVSQNWEAAGDVLGNGPAWGSSAEEKADFYKRQSLAAIDARTTEAQQAMGIVPVTEGQMKSFLTTDLGTSRLSFDASGGSSIASQRSAASMRAMGVREVSYGPGVIEAGGLYFDANQAQAVSSKKFRSSTQSERNLGIRGAAQVFRGGGSTGAVRSLEMSVGDLMNEKGVWDPARQIRGAFRSTTGEAVESLVNDVGGLIRGLPEDDPTRAKLLKEFDEQGLGGAAVSSFVGGVAGVSGDKLRQVLQARSAIAGASGLAYGRSSAKARTVRDIARRGAAVGSVTGIKDVDTQVEALLEKSKGEAMAAQGYGVKALTREEARAQIVATMGGSDELLQKEWAERLTAQPAYRRYEKFLRKGDRKRAQEQISLAEAATMAEGRGTFTDYEPIDIDERRYRSGMAATVSKTLGALGGILPGVSANEFIDKHFKTSVSEATLDQKSELHKPKGRRRSAGEDHERAAGFGAREEAMQTQIRTLKNIEKSTRALRGSVDKLHKEISG